MRLTKIGTHLSSWLYVCFRCELIMVIFRFEDREGLVRVSLPPGGRKSTAQLLLSLPLQLSSIRHFKQMISNY